MKLKISKQDDLSLNVLEISNDVNQSSLHRIMNYNNMAYSIPNIFIITI